MFSAISVIWVVRIIKLMIEIRLTCVFKVVRVIRSIRVIRVY